MAGSAIHRNRRPAFFENWCAKVEGRQYLGGYECPLFSDAWITGETSIGPYHFLNTVAHAANEGYDALAPVIVIRIDIHSDWEPPQMNKTDTSTFHGGSLTDELAALTSLAIGARFEPGPPSRTFRSQDEPGKPVAYYGYRTPVLLRDAPNSRLPQMCGHHSLAGLDWLNDWLEADPSSQIALIRSARLYRDAVWIADSQPALAWLLLVSAVETAANCWNRENGSDVERLRISKPILTECLEKSCPEMVEVVAREMADSIGVAKKFVDFSLSFFPPPPDARPPKEVQVQWTKAQLKSILKKVYSYRSRALHAGIPFPEPMCGVPRSLDRDWKAPQELPFGRASSLHGNVWRLEDTPMMLHVFEYFARKTLHSWGNSLVSKGGNGVAGDGQGG